MGYFQDRAERGRLLDAVEPAPPGTLDRIVDAVAVVSIIGAWTYLAVSWTALPERIPTRFDAGGAPSVYGPRSSLLALGGLQVATWALMSLVQRIPGRFLNVPIKVTVRNAARIRNSMVAMMRQLRGALVLTFGVTLIQSIRVALGQAEGIGVELLLLLLLAPLVAVFAGMAGMMRDTGEE